MSRQPENIPAGASAERAPNLRSGGTSISSVGPANWIIEGKFLQGWNTGKEWLQYRLSNNWLPGSSKASTTSGPSTKSGVSEKTELSAEKQSNMLPLSSRSSTTDCQRRPNSFSNHRSERVEQQSGSTGENDSQTDLSIETSSKSMPKWARQLQSFGPEVQSSQGSVGPNLPSVSSPSDAALQRPRPGSTIDEPPTSQSVESLPSMSNLGREDGLEGLRLAEIHSRTMNDKSSNDTSTVDQQLCNGAQELLSSHRVHFDVDASFSSCELGSLNDQATQVNATITAHDFHFYSRNMDQPTLSHPRHTSKSLRLSGNEDPSLVEEAVTSGTPYTSRTTSRSTRTADILDGMSELLQSSGSSSTSFPSVHSPESPTQGYDGESLLMSATTSHYTSAPSDELPRGAMPKSAVRSHDDISNLSISQYAPQEYRLGHYEQFAIGPTFPVSPRDVTVNMPAPEFLSNTGRGERWDCLPVTNLQAGDYTSNPGNSDVLNQNDEGQSSYEPLLPNQGESEHEVENPLWEAKGAQIVGRSKDSISSKVAAVYNAYRDRAGRASFVRDHKEKLRRSTCVLFLIFVLLLAGIVTASLLIPRYNGKTNSKVEVTPSSSLESIDSSPPSLVGVIGGGTGETGGPGQPPDVADQSIPSDADAYEEIVSQGEKDSTPVQAPEDAHTATFPYSRPPSSPKSPPLPSFQSPPPQLPPPDSPTPPSPPSPLPPTPPSFSTSSQLPIATCSVEDDSTIRNLDSLPVGSRQELLTSIQGPELTTLRTNLLADECYKIKTALNDYGDETKELKDFLTPFSSYLIVSVAPKSPEGRRRLMTGNLNSQRQLTADENFGDLTVVYEPGMKNLEASFSPPENSIISVTTSFDINGGGTRTRSFVFDVRGVVESRDADSNPSDRPSSSTAAIVEPPKNSASMGDLIENDIAPGIPPEISDLERERALEVEESPGPSSVQDLTASPPTFDSQQGSDLPSAPLAEEQGEDLTTRVANPPQIAKDGQKGVGDTGDGLDGIEGSIAVWPVSPREQSIPISPNHEGEPSTESSQEISPMDIGLVSITPDTGLPPFILETVSSDSTAVAPSPSGDLGFDSRDVQPPIGVTPHDRSDELPQSDDIVDGPKQAKEWVDDEVISAAQAPTHSFSLKLEATNIGIGTQSRLDSGEEELETEFEQIVEGLSSTGMSPVSDSHVPTDKEAQPISYGPFGSDVVEDTPGLQSDGSGDMDREAELLLNEGLYAPAPAPAKRIVKPLLSEFYGSHGSYGSYGNGSHGDTKEKTTSQIEESKEFWLPQSVAMEDLLDEAPEQKADAPTEGMRVDTKLRKESLAVQQEEYDDILEWDIFISPETPASVSPTDAFEIETDAVEQSVSFESNDDVEDGETAAKAPSLSSFPRSTDATQGGNSIQEQNYGNPPDVESVSEPPTSEVGTGDENDLTDELDINEGNEEILPGEPSVVDPTEVKMDVSAEEPAKEDNGEMGLDEQALASSLSPADISENENNLLGETLGSEVHRKSLPPLPAPFSTDLHESETSVEEGNAVTEGHSASPTAPPAISPQSAEDGNRELVRSEADIFDLVPFPSPKDEMKGISEEDMGNIDERATSLAPAPFSADMGRNEKDMENENSNNLSVGYLDSAPTSVDVAIREEERPIERVGGGEALAISPAPSFSDIMEREDTDTVGSVEPEISAAVPAGRDTRTFAYPFTAESEIEEQREGASAAWPEEDVYPAAEGREREAGGGEPAVGDEDQEVDVQTSSMDGGQRSDALAIETQANSAELGIATSSSQLQKTGTSSSKSTTAAGGDGESDAFSLWWLWVVMGGVAGLAAVAFYAATLDAGGGRGFKNMSRISPGPEPEAQSVGESSRGSVLPEMDPNSPRGAPTSISIWSEQERTAKLRADLDSAGHGGPKKRGTEGDPSVLSSVYFPFKTLFGAIHTGINTVFNKGDDMQPEKVIVSPSRSMTPELDSERCRAPDEGPSSRMGEPMQPEQEEFPSSARSTIPSVPYTAQKESSGGYLGDAMSTASEIGCSEIDAEEVDEPLIRRNVPMNISTEGSSMDWSQFKRKNDFQEAVSPAFSPRVAIKEMINMMSAIYRKVWKKNNRITSSGTSYSQATSGEQSVHWATKVQGYSAGTSGVSLRTDLPSLDSYYAENYGAVFPGARPQEHDF